MMTVALNIDSQAVPVQEAESKSIFGRIADMSEKTKYKILKYAQTAGMATTAAMVFNMWSVGHGGIGVKESVAAVGLCLACQCIDYARKSLRNKMQKDKAVANPDKYIDSYIKSNKEEIERTIQAKPGPNCCLEAAAAMSPTQKASDIKEYRKKIKLATQAKEVLKHPEEKELAARFLAESEARGTQTGKDFLAKMAMPVLTVGAGVAALVASRHSPAAGMAVYTSLALLGASVVTSVKDAVNRSRAWNKLTNLVSRKQKEI